jgi:hypothetical protein
MEYIIIYNMKEDLMTIDGDIEMGILIDRIDDIE